MLILRVSLSIRSAVFPVSSFETWARFSCHLCQISLRPCLYHICLSRSHPLFRVFWSRSRVCRQNRLFLKSLGRFGLWGFLLLFGGFDAILWWICFFSHIHGWFVRSVKEWLQGILLRLERWFHLQCEPW